MKLPGCEQFLFLWLQPGPEDLGGGAAAELLNGCVRLGPEQPQCLPPASNEQCCGQAP